MPTLDEELTRRLEELISEELAVYEKMTYSEEGYQILKAAMLRACKTLGVSGYRIEVGPLTEEQKRLGIAPQITLTILNFVTPLTD